jgi:hypothetical protein
MTIGTIYAGDTDTIELTVSPASSLAGSTVTAQLWYGGIAAPTFSISKTHEDMTIDADAGTISIPITAADWESVPERYHRTRITLTLEVEIRRNDAIRTLEHDTLTVLPERIL